MTGLLAWLLVAAPVPTTVADAGDAPTPTRPATTVELTPPVPEPPRDIYQLHLGVDVPVTIVGGSAGLVRILFEDQLARKSCPCDPTRINGLDRGTVGSHSAAAGIAANVTVYAVMAALPLMDLGDVGFNRTW